MDDNSKNDIQEVYSTYHLLVYIGAIVLLVPVILIASYYFILWGSWNYQPDFLQSEACLQKGGVYSSQQDRCWQAGECEDQGGFWYPIESRCVFDPSTIGD